jgi:hypothetical protein
LPSVKSTLVGLLEYDQPPGHDAELLLPNPHRLRIRGGGGEHGCDLTEPSSSTSLACPRGGGGGGSYLRTEIRWHARCMSPRNSSVPCTPLLIVGSKINGQMPWTVHATVSSTVPRCSAYAEKCGAHICYRAIYSILLQYFDLGCPFSI